MFCSDLRKETRTLALELADDDSWLATQAQNSAERQLRDAVERDPGLLEDTGRQSGLFTREIKEYIRVAKANIPVPALTKALEGSTAAILKSLQRRCSDPENALHQAVLYLYYYLRNFARWRPEILGDAEAVRKLLWTFAKNIARHEGRWERKHVGLDAASACEGAPIQEAIDLKSMLDGLSELEQTALLLKFSMGLSYEEIAPQVGKTAGHVGTILTRAKKKIRLRFQIASPWPPRTSNVRKAKSNGCGYWGATAIPPRPNRTAVGSPTRGFPGGLDGRTRGSPHLNSPEGRLEGDR
jgi:RNA polymerase sigma factor (sigma-70 family)